MVDSSSAAGGNKSKLGDEEFNPMGMRVLLVDESTTCLKIITKMLLNCGYKVTPKTVAQDAVEELCENPWSYDLFLSEVHMPAEVDGFHLLQHADTEMDLPVIVFSADDDNKTVLKCVKHGACDYLVKPLRNEELKNIWQHVYRRSLRNGRRAAAEAGGSNKGERKRFVWPKELHERFVSIVHQLGVHKATPNQILPLLNWEDLTRDQVSSHLQKFKTSLNKSKPLPSCTPIPTGSSVHGIQVPPQLVALQSVGTANNQHLIVPFNRITFVRPTYISQNGVLGGLVTGNVPTTATSVLARAFGREEMVGDASVDLCDHGTLIRDSSSTGNDGVQDELGETNAGLKKLTTAFELKEKTGK